MAESSHQTSFERRRSSIRLSAEVSVTVWIPGPSWAQLMSLMETRLCLARAIVAHKFLGQAVVGAALEWRSVMFV